MAGQSNRLALPLQETTEPCPRGSPPIAKQPPITPNPNHSTAPQLSRRNSFPGKNLACCSAPSCQPLVPDVNEKAPLRRKRLRHNELSRGIGGFQPISTGWCRIRGPLCAHPTASRIPGFFFHCPRARDGPLQKVLPSLFPEIFQQFLDNPENQVRFLEAA